MNTTNAPTTTKIPTGSYTIDPTHSRIGFVARHAMVTKVRGSFNEFDGTGTFDAENTNTRSGSRRWFSMSHPFTVAVRRVRRVRRARPRRRRRSHPAGRSLHCPRIYSGIDDTSTMLDDMSTTSRGATI